MASCFNGAFPTSACCFKTSNSKRLNRQVVNPLDDSPDFEGNKIQNNVIIEKSCVRNRSRHGWSGNDYRDSRNIEDIYTAPTTPLQRPEESEEYLIDQPVITKQPLKNTTNYNQNEEVLPKRKKVIFPSSKESQRRITCFQDPSEMRPNQIDICPTIWFRNCCTWQDLLEDAKPSNLENVKSGATSNISSNKVASEDSTEEPNLSKRMIANRICWRACFVSLCLPTCYPCYLCRTVRRSRRQGDILRREELMQHNKTHGLLEGGPDNCLNRTLFTQIREVKHRNKTASLESRPKPTATDPANILTQIHENLNNITEEAIESLEMKLEGNDKIPDQVNLTNNSSVENNVVAGDKNSKRSKVMNVNVIVLKSKYSQILHEYFSKKYDPNSNRSSNSNPGLDKPVPDSMTVQQAALTNPLCKTPQQNGQNGSSSILTHQALISSSPHTSYSDIQAKGPRFSDPLRPTSNTSKHVSALAILEEDSIDESNDTILISNSELVKTENKHNSISDNMAPSSLLIQKEIVKETQETKQETMTTTARVIEAEEDIRSLRSLVSSKSEVFYDAKEELSQETSQETLGKNAHDSETLRRRSGRDESNFDESYYGKTTKHKSDPTDEADTVTKKKNNRRAVSFSKASRRWSQLRTTNRISSNLSRISKRQSNVSNSKTQIQEEEEVQLRKKSSKGRNKTKKYSTMSNSSVYYDLHSDDIDEDYSDEEVENKGNPKHVEMKFAGNRTEIVEELGDLSFSMFDGDSVSKWKGKDLKLADNIPNIDLLVIGIEQNNVEELQSVLDIHSGIMSYIARYWRGFYPLFLIELTTNTVIENKDKEIYQSELDRLKGHFGDVHHIEVPKSSLDCHKTWKWLNECLARLFIHSRIYQCSRFYGKRIYLEDICPGGCELRKKREIGKQKVKRKFKQVYKKASILRAMSVNERNQEEHVPITTKIQEPTSYVISNK